MIEVTDEMLRAYSEATGINWAHLHINHRLGLAAVLSIVERDYSVFAHCEEPHPTEPTVCELARGHKGSHTATVERAVDW